MHLRRPRRIFRGTTLGVPATGLGTVLRSTVLVGLAGAGLGAVVLLAGRPPELPADVFARVPAAGQVTAGPQQVAVVDGGTLRLADTVVRLQGVTAPSRGRLCPDGLGGGYDCGAAASAALASLVHDRRVDCRLDGHDRSGLPQGMCEAAGTDLGQALVATGWARADAAGLREAEAGARAARIGLWHNGADPGF